MMTNDNFIFYFIILHFILAFFLRENYRGEFWNIKILGTL